jgi:hypothetical protein
MDFFSGYTITQKIKFLHVRDEETKKEKKKFARANKKSQLRIAKNGGA